MAGGHSARRSTGVADRAHPRVHSAPSTPAPESHSTRMAPDSQPSPWLHKPGQRPPARKERERGRADLCNYFRVTADAANGAAGEPRLCSAGPAQTARSSLVRLAHFRSVVPASFFDSCCSLVSLLPRAEQLGKPRPEMRGSLPKMHSEGSNWAT